jgi:glycosyltransferase involved in cell wall biosynthesis
MQKEASVGMRRQTRSWPAQSRLDVLFVISDLGIGGSERQLAVLASALAQASVSVAVYSVTDGPVREQLERAGVELMLGSASNGGGASRVIATACDLFRVMRRRRPRVAHFFLPLAYLIGAPIALLARVPVRIMSRRSLNNYQRNFGVRIIERVWHRTTHAVLGNSRGVVAQLKEEGVPPERLGLIYNGVEPRRVAATRVAARAAFGLPSSALVMSIVANLIAYKGHADLIDALARVSRFLPVDWRLLVVGRDDGVGDALRDQALRRGIAGHVLFLGSRDDVSSILAASDIGLLCSHQEGFSNAILESMAAGLPMIVSRVGGNAEAVLDGENGIVVPPQDPDQLAAAIARLARDPTLRARMGEAGRARATERFSVKNFVQSHHALYDALAAGKRPCDVPAVAIEV